MTINSKLIPVSSIFSPQSRYVRLACQGIIRAGLYEIENNEMVVEADEFILHMQAIADEENKNRKGDNNVK